MNKDIINLKFNMIIVESWGNIYVCIQEKQGTETETVDYEIFSRKPRNNMDIKTY